jgi:hypothetical protein
VVLTAFCFDSTSMASALISGWHVNQHFSLFARPAISPTTKPASHTPNHGHTRALRQCALLILADDARRPFANPSTSECATFVQWWVQINVLFRHYSFALDLRLVLE